MRAFASGGAEEQMWGRHSGIFWTKSFGICDFLILYHPTMDELCNKSLISLVLAAVMTVYPGGRESYKAASGK